jgi:UDP-glucose:(heptosyl)LPS alpha-1,3-glucosyltransferase
VNDAAPHNPLKIALVILRADPARGGAERYTVDLAEALAARGHAVSLVSGEPARTTADSPYQAVALDANGLTRLGRYRGFLDSLDGHLRAEPYDVVHAMLPVRRCDLYHPHAGIAADAVATGHLKYNSPLARVSSRWANRLNVKRQFFAKVERELLTGPNAPIVLCLSDYVKRNTLKHYPLDDAHLATLFNAIDLARFDPAKRPDARRQLRQRLGLADDDVAALMIAQDFERKGLRDAIAAVARVADARLKLVVVGKQDPAAYRRFAEQQGVTNRVIFAGRTGDPVAFHRAADLFVLPTRHDPCSLATLEALAMGLPVVSTAFNGACEIMTESRHGFVLPDPADVNALANALRRLLNNADRAAMAAACLELRPRLAYERHVDEVIRIYESVHARRTTARTAQALNG